MVFCVDKRSACVIFLPLGRLSPDAHVSQPPKYHVAPATPSDGGSHPGYAAAPTGCISRSPRVPTASPSPKIPVAASRWRRCAGFVEWQGNFFAEFQGVGREAEILKSCESALPRECENLNSCISESRHDSRQTDHQLFPTGMSIFFQCRKTG